MICKNVIDHFLEKKKKKTNRNKRNILYIIMGMINIIPYKWIQPSNSKDIESILTIIIILNTRFEYQATNSNRI